MLTLATAVLSLSALSETSLLRGRRSEWSGPAFTALRAGANDLFNKKDYAGAQALWQQGYRQAQAHHDTLSSLRFLNNIGSVHFGLMQYRQAIDAFAQARKLAAANGDRDTLSVTCSNLCSLYMQVGDMAAATAAAEQGLNVPSDTSLPYRSTMLVTLGLLASGSHDTPKALRYFRDAVEEAERYGADSNRFEAWNHYSQELLRAGDLDAAETASLNALHIGNLKTVREVRPAYLTLARIHRARGDTRTALALVERALAIPARVSDHQLWKMYFLYERARVRLSQGNPPAALPDLRLALSYAHDWREAIVPSDGLRSGAEFYLRDLYDSYIDAASTTNAAAEAFLAAEEERSASLVQMLTSGSGSEQQPGRSRWPESYWEDLARLRALEIVRVAKRSAYDAKAAAQIRERLSEIEVRAGADFILTPTEKGENILSPSTLHGVQDNIGPEEAVLSLHLGTSASLVWALTNNRLEMHHLASGGRLAALAERFHRAVEESAPGRDQLGAQLYTELFGSLSAPILEKRSWIITADDALFEIPFEALVVRNTDTRLSRTMFLIEQHATRRIPSAFMLARAAAHRDHGPFLALGDGVYNTADERWPAAHRTLGPTGFSSLFRPASTGPPLQLPRLVSSTYEIESCGAAWSSRGPSILLTGTQASRQSLISALDEKPAVIHIASHVLSAEGDPGHPMIDLGLTAAGAPDVLTTKDVTGLRAGGALVVVSGCSSAAARSVRGAGIMGLTRAWLLAGASAVVGSRWPVQDDTKDLFRSFYAHLAAPQGSPGPGAALQQAQLQMLHSGTWRSDPRYWGAFYLLTKD